MLYSINKIENNQTYFNLHFIHETQLKNIIYTLHLKLKTN